MVYVRKLKLVHYIHVIFNAVAKTTKLIVCLLFDYVPIAVFRVSFDITKKSLGNIPLRCANAYVSTSTLL